MRNGSIWDHKLYLDYLFSKSAELKNDELLSHWSRYLCVLVSGWIEVSVIKIYREYVQKRASQEVQRYVLTKLGIRSAKMNNIVDLTSKFSVSWSQALQNATDGAIKDAVDNIVKNRHLIAHGSTCDISFLRLKDYYQKAVKAIQILEAQCAT